MRGLKFTPTPQKNTLDLKTDIENFTRKLRLLKLFQDNDEKNGNINKNAQQKSNTEKQKNIESLAKPKSDFTPHKTNDKFFEQQIEFLNDFPLDNFETKQKSNLSKSEWLALKTLINDKSIIIKKADKGGAVVILCKNHYESMIYAHLNDIKTYKKLDKNTDDKIYIKLKKLVEKHKSCFTSEEYAYLTKFKHKTSAFYGLPKIHKSKILEEQIEKQNSEIIIYDKPQDLKLRPIVGGPMCPTKPLSFILDKILKPLLIHVPSYIKDNIDFLEKCN